MIAYLKPYPVMKDSSAPWLGEMPEHWEFKRGKSLLQCIDIRSRAGDEDLLTVSSEYGVVPRSSATVTMFRAESYVGYKLCWPGDLVINSLWAWSRGLGVSRFHGIVSSAYGVYRLRHPNNGNPDYMHRLVRSTPFNYELRIRSKGIWISRLQLTDEAFLQARILFPPLSEQTAIVRFLDYAERRIRRYIRAKQRLVALLHEQKQAIIQQAVTGQIDVSTGRPYHAYKDSGVEWLGKVPQHWEIHRLGNLAEMRISNVDKHTQQDERLVRLCNYVDVYKNDYIRPSMKLMRASATKDEIVRFHLVPGDVLITKDSEAWNDIAVPALVVESADNLVSGYHLALLRPFANLLTGGYLLRAIQSSGVKSQFHVQANGVTRYGLSQGAIKSVRLPVPPVVEQTAIVRFLDHTTANIDAAVGSSHREIDLLDECRTRLIADVVTGKLDVREVASSMPEEAPLTEEDLND